MGRRHQLSSRILASVVAILLASTLVGFALVTLRQRSQLERDYQQRELDANAKGVEILTRAAGFSEARALRTMYDYLAGVQWALDRYPRLNLRGHKSPCEEIADLLARFPQQRAWQQLLLSNRASF